MREGWENKQLALNLNLHIEITTISYQSHTMIKTKSRYQSGKFISYHETIFKKCTGNLNYRCGKAIKVEILAPGR